MGRDPLASALSNILHRYGLLLLVILALTTTAPALAQEEDVQLQARRQLAFEYFQLNNFIEALPLFENLAAAKPNDAEVQSAFGFCLIGYAATLTDEAARRQARLRARQVLQRSLELKPEDEGVRALFETIPEDGGSATFSEDAAVDAAMREGEAAFARGDFPEALTAYARALALDPKHYEAALFTGDVYFKQQETEQAAFWFARATVINPDRETAYRYWGDALLFGRRMEEARLQFLRATVAEPYNRLAWIGLSRWAQANGVQLAHPRIDIPQGPETKGKETTIYLNADSLEKKDGSQNWLFYSIARAAWQTVIFSKKFPDEPAYRHTLAEEVDALRGVLEGVRRDLQEGTTASLDPSLVALKELDDKGLLEAYVLFARPDDGIAQDYVTYRAGHRDDLFRYLDEYVAPGLEPAKEPDSPQN